MSIIEAARKAAEERKFRAGEKHKAELLGRVARLLAPLGELPEYHFRETRLVINGQDMEFELVGGNLEVEVYDVQTTYTYRATVNCLADLGDLAIAKHIKEEEEEGDEE